MPDAAAAASSRLPLAANGHGVVTAALPVGLAADGMDGARLVTPGTIAVAVVAAAPTAAAVADARDGLVARLCVAGVTPTSPEEVTVVVVPGVFGSSLLRRTEVWVEVAA